MLLLRSWGTKTGYPQIVPGSPWAAVTVFHRPIVHERRPFFLWCGAIVQCLGFLRLRDFFYRKGCRELGDLVPFYTAIYPFMDNPNFEWRYPDKHPWLSKRECEVINAPHRKQFWKKEARTFAQDKGALESRKRSRLLLRREPILRWSHENPGAPFENTVGGWLPDGASTEGLSQTACDLAYRQHLKINRDFALADLIRRVVEGGGVEIRDAGNGVMWFFQE